MIEVRMMDKMGTDLTVVNAAKVSFHKESPHLDSKGEGLIKYLADHEHISPFGHCFASFRVKAPLFVARQLVKHQYLRWNEVSRRYVDDPPEFYHPDKWYGRPVDKKQGAGEQISTKDRLEIDWSDSLSAYEQLLEAGVCPEQARIVLPLSTMTEWWWSGSLDAFADMYNLRSKPDTQEESRYVANKIGEYMSQCFPVAWKELTKDG
jgi:thymidylate synthase (FAD)